MKAVQDLGTSGAPHPTIALLQTSSLTSVVQGELERLILSGELVPGAKLGEVALATRLGVSRGPLREAFRMLEEAGLVRTEKNRGVFVRNIPIAEAIEIFDLRAAMDELVGRRLAEHIQPAELREIKGLVEQMEQAVKAQDARAYHLLNLGFHDRLVELAGNGKLTAIYRKLIKELSLFRRLNLADSWLMPISAGEHRAIVKAIASGDAESAGRAMYAHVMESKERTIRNHQAGSAVAQTGSSARPAARSTRAKAGVAPLATPARKTVQETASKTARASAPTRKPRSVTTP
jgi:phosphonate utilization transcriptional regulator